MAELTRDEMAALLARHVVDTAAAVEMLGLAGRTSLHYYVDRDREASLRPLARFGPSNVFWREDVLRLARAIDHRRSSSEIEEGAMET